MKGNFLSKFLYGICITGLVALAVTLIGLPWIVPKILGEGAFYSAENHIKILTLLYMTGLPAWMILWYTKNLARNIINREPFSDSSLVSLKGISILAFIICIGYVGGAVFIKLTAVIFIIILGTFMVSLIGAILYKLVQVAIEIQEENELTI